MAQAPVKHDPHPAPKNHEPAPKNHEPVPVKHAEDEPAQTTIGEEQRARSEEMEAMGVDAWMKAHSAPAPTSKS